MAENPSNIVPDQIILLEGGSKLVPAPSAGDSGKVLGVLNSNGDIGWTEDREGMAQQQADWAETDSSKVTYIANKPSGQMAPASTTSDSGKVLKVNAQGAPVWGDASAGIVEFDWDTVTLSDIEGAITAGKTPVMLYVPWDNAYTTKCYLQKIEHTGSGDNYVFVSTPEGFVNTPSDQSTSVTRLIMMYDGSKGGSVQSVSAILSSSDGSVTMAQGATSAYLDLSVANPLPASTSSDADKVLTVNSSGTPEWATAQGGGGGTPALPSIDEAHHSYILTAHKHTLPGNVQVVTADWVAPSFTYFYPAAYSDGSGYQLSDWEYYQTLGQSIQTALLTAFENFDPWYYDTPYEIQARLGVNTSADISLRLPLDCSTSRNLSIQTDLEIGGSTDGMSTDITLYKMRGTGFIGNNNDAPVFLSTIHLPIVTDVLYQDITGTYFSITPESGYNVSVPSADSYDPDVLKHFGIYITLYPNGQMSSRNIV